MGRVNESEWYAAMDQHPEIREHVKFSGRGGHCGTCRSTGTPGSGNFGPDNVSGYWCRRLQVPVSGNKTCPHWISDN